MSSSQDQWITFDNVVELVRARLDASIGRAEAATKAARASGEVRTRNRPIDDNDPVLLTNDDGLMTWNQKPGVAVSNIATSDRKLLFSKDDLMDWLGRQPPPQKVPSSSPDPAARRIGRPPAYDWQAIQKAVVDLMDENGDFSVDDPDWNAQARLEEALNDRFGVGTSALRERLPKFLIDWRKSKAGN